jgi:hypothetical protein
MLDPRQWLWLSAPIVQLDPNLVNNNNNSVFGDLPVLDEAIVVAHDVDAVLTETTTFFVTLSSVVHWLPQLLLALLLLSLMVMLHRVSLLSTIKSLVLRRPRPATSPSPSSPAQVALLEWELEYGSKLRPTMSAPRASLPVSR